MRMSSPSYPVIKYRRDLGKIVTVPGDAAEIGVAEGYFSADMLSWEINFPTVYMVDRWRSVPTQAGDASNPQEWHDKNLAAACGRVKKYGRRARILQGDSADMASQVPNWSLALLYIDGDHSLLGVTMDLVAWLPKMKRGGIIAFHDYEAPEYGVKPAVQKFAASLNLDICLLPEDKKEDAGAYVVL